MCIKINLISVFFSAKYGYGVVRLLNRWRWAGMKVAVQWRPIHLTPTGK